MKLSVAIAKRISSLCEERGISLNKLSMMSCITQSTLNSIMKNESNNPKILTIYRICYGLNISIVEFFDDKIFENIDLEI